MPLNTKLSKARNRKNDEFYTQFADVAAELQHYEPQFRGKIILCNCDDPSQSAFWRYLHLNFERLGLKKLIATHHSKTEPVYKTEYCGGNDADIAAGTKTRLRNDGDFRSQECLGVLKSCDIVVTNPPFSLFREYIQTLMVYNKKFLIIGNMNCVTYKEIFPLIKNGDLWLGVNARAGSRKGNTLWFIIPDDVEAKYITINASGERTVQVSAWWFTNLDHPKRHEPLQLQAQYNPNDYPQYDNYAAINVNKTGEIPSDYFGRIGVPISFLNKHCVDQFEIIGATESEGRGFSNGLFQGGAVTQPLVNGKRVYKRIFIRRK